MQLFESLFYITSWQLLDESELHVEINLKTLSSHINYRMHNLNTQVCFQEDKNIYFSNYFRTTKKNFQNWSVFRVLLKKLRVDAKIRMEVARITAIKKLVWQVSIDSKALKCRQELRTSPRNCFLGWVGDFGTFIEDRRTSVKLIRNIRSERSFQQKSLQKLANGPNFRLVCWL